MKRLKLTVWGAEIPVIFCNHCKTVFKVENDRPYLNEDKTYDYLAKKNIEAWNTRKPMQTIVERMEAVMDEAQDKMSEEFIYYDGYGDGVDRAIRIVKEEAGL